MHEDTKTVSSGYGWLRKVEPLRRRRDRRPALINIDTGRGRSPALPDWRHTMHKFIMFINPHPRHGIADVCMHIADCRYRHDCGDYSYGGAWVEIEAEDEERGMEEFCRVHKKWGASWHIYAHPCVALKLRGRHIVSTPEMDCREEI